ncbi:MAG: LysR family transcriptional regulator [Actinobacteria bacterium]|nr:LysR family transcriptional regulator [Actinomycetota bacterium]
MRIEQLEYIVAVARLGSFRRAAEELHISQPALSESVRNLERELGVAALERNRSGTKMTARGRELLPHMLAVIDAANSLRDAADIADRNGRVVHLGTVTAATAPLLTPAIREFREAHPDTEVEVRTAQQEEIHAALLAGGMDLGLVNYLDDERAPDDLESTVLLRGQPVVCIRPDSPLAEHGAVTPRQLAAQPLIAMRSGYVMHRYLRRLFDGEDVSFSYSADGAEIGKLMVAEGLGAAVLPDYSVSGDPLEESGAVTYRPIAGNETAVELVIHRRRSNTANRTIADLHRLFVDLAAKDEAFAPA